MSFWKPLDYFNGSKFYRKRSGYEREFFERARQIARAHKLNIKDYYQNTRTKRLSNFEFKEYLAFKKLGEGEAWKAKYAKKALAGSIGSVQWHESPQGLSAIITRKGLKDFCNALANYRATIETGYVWHLVDRKTKQRWIIQASLNLAIFLVANAIAAALIIGKATFLRKALNKYTRWFDSFVFFMASMVSDLKNIYENTKKTEFQAKALSLANSNAFLREANDLREHKKYSGNSNLIFNAYRNYANGDIYKSQAPGSETSTTTQAYNPSAHLTNTAKTPFIDEQIQNRAHYTLAGNAGAFEKICPDIPLQTTAPLKNDIEYKLNFFTLQNQRLQRGYAELAQFISDEDGRLTGNPRSASEYLQALYENDLAFFANNYFTYAQSKDFLGKLKNYNYALKADFDYFRKSGFEDSEKVAMTAYTPTETDTNFDYDAEEEAPQTSEEQNFLNLISSFALENADTQEEQESAFDTQSEFFKTHKRAFLEKIKTKEASALEIILKIEKEFHNGEMAGIMYDTQDIELIEREIETYIFIKYGLSTGALSGNYRDRISTRGHFIINNVLYFEDFLDFSSSPLGVKATILKLKEEYILKEERIESAFFFKPIIYITDLWMYKDDLILFYFQEDKFLQEFRKFIETQLLTL
ncbi:hypothetical protein [Helicobacter himalayensis]|uniref:hypothetical protein n=1 Tax=Helicobacter himalayensis TaxID=1591088 RepID=UPI00082D35DE|nr:hypothetical protein [Helicobacter himalayensis]